MIDVAAAPASPGTTLAKGTGRLGRHVALLALALALLVPLSRPSVPTADEGTYGLQADALAGGQWTVHYPFVGLDPSGRWFPLSNSSASASGREHYAYLKHPVFSVVQAQLGRVFGRDLGYLLLPLAGVLGTAAAAWVLARRLRPGSEQIAFWLAGGGPVLFSGFVIWAHAPAAALAGLALIGAMRLRDEPAGRLRALDQAAVALGLAGCLLLRSEGLLFGLALLSAMGLDRLWAGDPRPDSLDVRRRGRPTGRDLLRRLPASAARVLPGGLALLASRLGERAWIVAVGGAAPQDLVVRSLAGEPSWLAARRSGLWSSTFAGSLFSDRAGLLPALVLLAAVVVAARGRLRRPALVPAVVVVVAGATAIQQAAIDVDRVTGIVAAWPLAVIGVVALGARVEARWRLPAVTVAVFVTAVWATQYADGGAFQWGGRLLQLATVPLAAAAAAGLRTLVEERSGDARRALVAAVVLLLFVGSVASMVSLRSLRGETEVALDSIAAETGPVAVATNLELPRLMWRYDIDWLHADRDDLPTLLGKLRSSTDLRRISVVSGQRVEPSDVAAFGRISARRAAGESGVVVYEVSRA